MDAVSRDKYGIGFSGIGFLTPQAEGSGHRARAAPGMSH